MSEISINWEKTLNQLRARQISAREAREVDRHGHEIARRISWELEKEIIRRAILPPGVEFTASNENPGVLTFGEIKAMEGESYPAEIEALKRQMIASLGIPRELLNEPEVISHRNEFGEVIGQSYYRNNTAVVPSSFPSILATTADSGDEPAPAKPAAPEAALPSDFSKAAPTWHKRAERLGRKVELPR